MVDTHAIGVHAGYVEPSFERVRRSMRHEDVQRRIVLASQTPREANTGKNLARRRVRYV